MPRFRLFQFVLAALALCAGSPALAQTWGVVEPAGDGARASVCPIGEEGTANFLCFRLECSALQPLHFTLDVASGGEVAERLAVGVGVDGGEVGVLNFTPRSADGYTHFTAGFDPRLHEELVDLLQRGRRASLTLNWANGPQEVEMGLTRSADSLYTVMEACPKPTPPVGDPASLVLDEVVRACGDLGGVVTMEPGFERREDLDGDGREDLVIDYAAAACSEAASLNCGSGGCTVGFFLARDEGYSRMFADVIRGYEVYPGGFLALDLHGTACGLYGFEACRKVFDVAGDAPVLVEELAGPGAEAMAAAGIDPAAPETPAAETPEAGADEVAAVVVAVTEGVEIVPEVPAETAPVAEVPAETVAALEVPAETAPVPEVPVEPAPVAEVPAETAPVPEVPGETAVAAAAEAVADPAQAAPAAEGATPAVAETGPAADPAADPAPRTAQAEPVIEPATGAAAETEPMTLAAVTPEKAPPAQPAAQPDKGSAEAAADRQDDGPSSRHAAGPAPAVAEDAAFRGDGTLIRPDDTLR